MGNNPVIVVGGGHAGIEAALSVSRLGLPALIITMDGGAIGRLSCNPAIGGLAKSHLVKEIDALGGIMGLASDANALQYKTLNKTKGRAVWATRIQIDKKKYPFFIQSIIARDKNIGILEDEVVSLLVKKNKICGVTTRMRQKIICSAVIITCGTFLNGLIHIGNETFRAGRIGERGSYGLTENLVDLGFYSARLKTGTPPRISKKSIDFSSVEIAPGDKDYSCLSIMSSFRQFKQDDCFLINTNAAVHDTINKNIDKSALFSGKIKGVGPRYCPSIEDKVHRFSSRSSHHLFLEPEWKGSDQIYVNGFSTSLPLEIQKESLQKIKALSNVEFIRPGYAIEYDFIPPRQLKSTLESKNVGGLFFAGQINGTSGYEEAAAQGLIAGINAAKYLQKKDSLCLARSVSYIGVMIDDLITGHLDEPYRMFTSRAEHRLFLRADNCYSRLFSFAVRFEILSAKQQKKQKDYLLLVENIKSLIDQKTILKNNKKIPLKIALKSPDVQLKKYLKSSSLKIKEKFCDALFEVETSIKYAGYIENERERIQKNFALENLVIPQSLDYNDIQGLSNESRERLSFVLPQTVGQASRVFGIRPTDVTLLCIFIKSLVSRET